MAFKVLDMSEIRRSLAISRPKLVKQQKPGHVSLGSRSKNGQQQFIISRHFNHLFDGVKKIALEYDDETRTLAIRAAAADDPSLSLMRVGYSRPGESSNCTISATLVRRYLGIPDGYKGKFAAKVKGDRLLVNLKPAFTKKAQAASAA